MSDKLNLDKPMDAQSKTIENRMQIDRIISLARLGSDPNAIDPMLDDLRSVTATWDGQQPLDQANESRLNSLESQLKNYLINTDPLRRFTLETLEKSVSETDKVKINPKRDLYVVLGSSIGASAMMFILPVFGLPLQKSLLLTIPVFLVVLHIGIAWLYLSALSNFKQEFRQAFVLICAGIVLLSVTFSHYTLIELLGLGDQQLFRYGGITGLATLSYGLFYFGLRKYAGLLNIKNFFTSVGALLGISAAVVVVAILVPHGGENVVEPFFDLSFACLCLFSVFLFFDAGVAGKITKSVTPAYAKSMKWLYIYLVAGFIGSLGGTLGLPIVGQLSGGFLYVLLAVLGIGPQLILLYTGYLFKKETSL